MTYLILFQIISAARESKKRRLELSPTTEIATCKKIDFETHRIVETELKPNDNRHRTNQCVAPAGGPCYERLSKATSWKERRDARRKSRYFCSGCPVRSSVCVECILLLHKDPRFCVENSGTNVTNDDGTVLQTWPADTYCYFHFGNALSRKLNACIQHI